MNATVIHAFKQKNDRPARCCRRRNYYRYCCVMSNRRGKGDKTRRLLDAMRTIRNKSYRLEDRGTLRRINSLETTLIQLGATLLRHLLGPGDLLLLQLPADIPESSQSPDASPHERRGPADDIASLGVDGEDQDGAERGHGHGADAPEESEAAQHGAEDVAGFVAAVEGFAVFGAAGTIYTDDVFDHGVDSGSQLGAFGNAGDAAGSGDLEVAAYVDEEELDGEGVQH
jgi:hypothetical protein